MEKENENINKNEFATFDLMLASALTTIGCELLRLDKSNPKKVQFIFRQDENIKQAMNNYFSGKLKLSALKLLNNLKNLKNRIYSDM